MHSWNEDYEKQAIPKYNWNETWIRLLANPNQDKYWEKDGEFNIINRRVQQIH